MNVQETNQGTGIEASGTPEMTGAEYLTLGNQELEAGNIERGIELLNQAVKIHPSLSPAYNSLGVAYLLAGDQAAARESLEKSLRLSPGNIEARYNLAAVLAQTGDILAAIDHLEFLDSAKLADEGIQESLFLYLLEAGQYKKAYGLLKRFIETGTHGLEKIIAYTETMADVVKVPLRPIAGPETESADSPLIAWRLHEILGDILRSIDETDQGIELYLQAFNDGYRDKLFISKIEEIADLVELPERLEIFREIFDSGYMSFGTLTKYGQLLLSMNQWAMAEKVINGATPPEGDHPDFLVLSGWVHQYFGRFPEASASFIKALKYSPQLLDHCHVVPLAQTLPLEGNIPKPLFVLVRKAEWDLSKKQGPGREEQRDWPEAEGDEYSCDIEALFLKMFVQGHCRGCEKFMFYLTSHEGGPQDLSKKGWILSRLGLNAEAEIQFHQALEKGEDSSQYQAWSATLAAVRGNFLKSITEFERALEEKPDDSALRIGRKASLRKAGKKALPGIFINTVAKSGSAFIVWTLSDMLKIPFVQVVQGDSEDKSIYLQDRLFDLSMGRIITQSHIEPDKAQLKQLARYIEKIVFHVREPRQTALSYVHYLDVIPRDRLPTWIPDDYFSRTFLEKLNFQVTSFLPWVVSLVELWVGYANLSDCPLEILITDFRDLKADKNLFFKKILDFYEIDAADYQFKFPDPKPGDRHFRKGLNSEWKEVYPDWLKEKSSAMIPDYLKEYFNWDR